MYSPGGTFSCVTELTNSQTSMRLGNDSLRGHRGATRIIDSQWKSMTLFRTHLSLQKEGTCTSLGSPTRSGRHLLSITKDLGERHIQGQFLIEACLKQVNYRFAIDLANLIKDP